jgi:hypothetical protein
MVVEVQNSWINPGLGAFLRFAAVKHLLPSIKKLCVFYYLRSQFTSSYERDTQTTHQISTKYKSLPPQHSLFPSQSSLIKSAAFSATA